VPRTAQSQPGRLSLESIVDTAARLIAEQGVEALSMRRLAQECGVGAMTLYGYVRTKDELLEALLDRQLSAIEYSAEQTLAWQERIRSAFGGVRNTFLEHPELLPILATHRLDGLGAYRGAEAVFAALRAAGLDGPRVIYTFDALVSFTIGFVQRELDVDRVTTSPLAGLRQLPRDEFPNVIDMAGQLVTRDMDAGFNAGLDLLIAGITNWVHRA
jgi:AcrR family transcriptional regulator